MRCFFALPIHGPVQLRLAEALTGWRQQWPEVRWEAAPALHLTLQFIGDWPPERLAELAAAAANLAWEPFELEMSGLGAFPDRRRPRLLWAGVEPSPPLRHLAGALAERLARLGIPREDRPFTPHISLGRPPRGVRLRDWGSGRPLAWGRMTAAEFHLYETIAGLPPAERYQIRERFPPRQDPASQAR